MKKYLSITILLLSTVFLFGCSAPGSSNPTGTPAAPAPSSILKSDDGGKNWEFKSKTTEKIGLDSVDVLNIAINPYDGKNVLVGTLKNGILKTDDGGESWTLVKFPAEKVYGLAFDFADSRIVYASGVWQDRGKVFKSINGGAEWNEIYTAPSNGPLVISLTLDKKNSNTLFATTSDNQVMKSADAGISWKSIFTSPSPATKIAIDNSNNSLLYLVLLNGDVLRSKDGGNTISEMSKEMSRGISVVETDPVNANWVYAAGKAGLFRSKDAGNTWETLKTLGDSKNFPVKAVAINPMNSTEIIYGAAQATYKSVDGGMNWTPFQLQTAKTVSVLEYSATEPNVAYLGLRKN